MIAKLVLKILVAFELCALLFSWINLRKPWIDPLDGSSKPTQAQTIILTHVSTLAFFVVAFAFYEIFKRIWRASNRRR